MASYMANLAQKIYHRLTNSYPAQTVVNINNFFLGKEHPAFIVAELGINHNGDVEIAKKLIDVAVEEACQAVKFQKRTISKVYTPEELAKPREVPRDVLENAIRRGVLSVEAIRRLKNSDLKNSTNGDQKLALELTEEEYREIDEYCKNKGILWFASPWDEESVDFLEKFDVPCHKIASASITYHDLLRKVKATRRPVILSTGMSTMEEIKTAVDILGTNNLVLLHTVSTYPSAEKDVNLRLLVTLKSEFPDVPIGYSGHEKGLAITVAAATLGAHLIERHLTLDRAMYGSDQAASIEPHELKQLVADIRAMETAYGHGKKEILESEVPIREKLRRKTA